VHLGKIFEDGSEVFKRLCPIETPLLTISALTERLVIDVSRGKAVFHRLDLLSKKTRATSDTSLAPIIVIAEIRKRQGLTLLPRKVTGRPCSPSEASRAGR
jgi:hypothetical protein